MGNLTEMMFYNDSVPGHHIATHFCTVHDNCAVMIWAKCCIDCCIIRITAECFHWSYRNFRSIAPNPVLAAFLRTSWLSIFRELLSLACFLFFFFWNLMKMTFQFIISLAQWSCWGGILVSLLLSVRPSVRPSVPHPMSTLAPTVLVGSILCLYIISSNVCRV